LVAVEWLQVALGFNHQRRLKICMLQGSKYTGAGQALPTSPNVITTVLPP
jgi:hypothetical protein